MMLKKIKKENLITSRMFLDNGTNNTERRIVSVSSCHKADDGTYIFVGKSRLLRSVRDIKNKSN